MTVALTLLTVGALLLFTVLERIVAAHQRAGGSSRLLRNVGMGLLGLVATFAVVTPVSVAATGLGPAWRAEWPMAIRLITDLLVLELFIYWWHRAMHEVPFLWRFHRVHHYDAFLDVSSAIRFHPGEVILSAFLRGGVIAATDVAASSILIMDALVIICAGFHHSNISLPRAVDDAIRALIVSPRHHRIHHIPEQRYTDSNYGTILTIWDRLFRSWEEAPTEGRYGVQGSHEKPLAALITDPAHR